MAVLVLGIVGSTWQAKEATRARSAAEAAQKQADAERQRAERQLYAANMNLAQQAWEQNNGERVRQLLSDSATYPDRGFEWYYLQRQAHQALKTFHGHTAAIWSLALSPDGRSIVTGSEDMTAKVWDLATGKELLTLRGHGGEVYSVAFSPDGQRIVTGSMDQTAQVWDATSGRRLLILKHGCATGRGGVFSGRSTDRHRRQRSDGPGLGRRRRQAIACFQSVRRRLDPAHRVLSRRPADTHGKPRSDRQGVGGGQRPRIVHSSRAQQRGLRGVFSGWPTDRDRQS